MSAKRKAKGYAGGGLVPEPQPAPYVPPPPTLHVDGAHAKKLRGQKVGQPVHIMVHGRIASLSQRTGSDGKPEHSASIEIGRMTQQKKPRRPPVP